MAFGTGSFKYLNHEAILGMRRGQHDDGVWMDLVSLADKANCMPAGAAGEV